MARYLLRRAVFVLAVCVGIIFFVFFGMRMAADARAGRASYRLGPPARYAWTRTTSYIGGIARGDWGTIEIRHGRYHRRIPVWSALLTAYPSSMGLLAIALLTAVGIGVPLGIVAARGRESIGSLGLLSVTLLGVSAPTFLVAALIQIAEITWYRHTRMRLIPVGGYGWDLHLVVPALVLAARPLAHLVRVSYMAFGEVFAEPYIATAHAKGLTRRLLTRGHALPNAAIPILTALGVSLRFALGSLPVVEYFVGWPGIGARLLESIQQDQQAGVAGMALALGLTIMLVNLALDVAYRLIDPRLAARDAAGSNGR